jgi:hypothetical protein
MHTLSELDTPGLVFASSELRSSSSESIRPIDGILPSSSRHTRRTAASSRHSESMMSRSRMVGELGRQHLARKLFRHEMNHTPRIEPANIDDLPD